MKPHGRPVSACCNAKLAKEPNGPWTEWRCVKCGNNTDENGKLYTYGVTDYYNTKKPND